jgi:hypothetical protein
MNSTTPTILADGTAQPRSDMNARKTYSKPQLTRLGLLRKLTRFSF